MNSQNGSLRGWLVVAVGFGALALSFTGRALLGLTMTSWEDAYGWSRGFVSSAGAVALVTMAIVAPLSGNLADRVGARPVLVGGLAALAAAGGLAWLAEARWLFILALGVFAGVGYGLVAQHVVAAVLAGWFEARRGLATGFAIAGSTAGQLLLVPVMAYIATHLAWHGPFLANALLAVALIPLVWLVAGRKAPIRVGTAQQNEPLRSRLSRLWHAHTFRALFIAFTLCGFTTTGVVEAHLFPYAALCGFVPLDTASAYSVLAGFNLVGMILAGWLTDRVHRPMLLGCIFLLRAGSFVVLMHIAGSLPALYLFAAMFGVLNFSVFPVIASLVASHLGVGVMGLALGLLFAGHSLGAALGMTLAGLLYDLFQQYLWTWLIALALALTAGLVTLTIRDGERGAPALRPA